MIFKFYKLKVKLIFNLMYFKRKVSKAAIYTLICIIILPLAVSLENNHKN